MEYFKNVKVEGNTIVWEQGEDIAPEILYYDSVAIQNIRICNKPI